MPIENMLLRTFAEFSNAQQARQALLAAGFTPDCISFTAKEDEAGPVTGNFVIDRNSDPDSDRREPQLTQGYDPNETQSSAPVDWGRSYLLMIEAQDAEQMKQATEIAEQFGGVDVEQLLQDGKSNDSSPSNGSGNGRL